MCWHEHDFLRCIRIGQQFELYAHEKECLWRPSPTLTLVASHGWSAKARTLSYAAQFFSLSQKPPYWTLWSIARQQEQFTCPRQSAQLGRHGWLDQSLIKRHLTIASATLHFPVRGARSLSSYPRSSLPIGLPGRLADGSPEAGQRYYQQSRALHTTRPFMTWHDDTCTPWRATQASPDDLSPGHASKGVIATTTFRDTHVRSLVMHSYVKDLISMCTLPRNS
jgi:hypothetical protein